MCCADGGVGDWAGGGLGEGEEEGEEGAGQWIEAWRCWRKCSRVEQMISVVAPVWWSRM